MGEYVVSKYDDGFFEEKRPWSLIKDQILSNYMLPYIAKVRKLNRPIVLIDGYAGPGVFEDGQVGSPLIMCSAAEKFAKGYYSAHFFNIKQEYHEKLESVIKRAGWSQSAHCYRGNSMKHIKKIPQIFENHTVFLYLDPFGLKGCGFDQLEPYLTRPQDCSTDIVLTMCMPVIHRLATPNVIKGSVSNKVNSYHQTLTQVFGGDYWKEILHQPAIDAETKEFRLIQAYLNKLKQYLPITGFCPVRKNSDGRIKYFVVFVSRHPDAMLLMNDIMHKAYFSHMHKADYEGTLFEAIDWKEMPTPEERGLENLYRLVQNLISLNPGKTREDIWLKLIQDSFMLYDTTTYLQALKHLSEEKRIEYKVDPATKRHNENSKLFLISNTLW